ncbi:MAG: helix-turn-helix domain-containing protein [Deltaproteobacteria bacterium]|jgi:excisionase family DNA binding protein|nr:helix-turn-helix domain-containing protein [Deltaproteobacteria bacterium]
MDAKTADVLTSDELAAFLKISTSTVYKLARADKIPAQKIGRHWLFKKGAIESWLEEIRAIKPNSGENR